MRACMHYACCTLPQTSSERHPCACTNAFLRAAHALAGVPHAYAHVHTSMAPTDSIRGWRSPKRGAAASGAVGSSADLRVVMPSSADERASLPLRYARLMQQFDCLDTALSFLKTRRQTEVCTFEVLKKSVQDIDKRDFTLRNLMQIVAVTPKAYRLSWVKKTDRYQLVVDFALHAVPGESAGPGKITPSALLRRKTEFRKHLEALVHKHRGSSQGGSGSGRGADGDVGLVDDIEPAQLPPRPDHLAAAAAAAGPIQASADASPAVKRALMLVASAQQLELAPGPAVLGSPQEAGARRQDADVAAGNKDGGALVGSEKREGGGEAVGAGMDGGGVCVAPVSKALKGLSPLRMSVSVSL